MAPLPQTTPFAEFNSSIPADVSAPLRPHLCGGQAETHRYSNAAEKAGCSVGAYVPASNTLYAWPSWQNPGTVLDLTFVQVNIDGALLQYFQDLIGSGQTVAPVANTPQQIVISGTAGFKANGVSYPRMAALKDRDVQINDAVTVSDNAGHVLNTYVAGLIADKTATSVAAATSDANNAIAQPSSNPGAAPAVTATGGGTTGGSLSAGTYFVRYTFAGPFGETSASDATSVTVAAGNIPQATIPALPTGATSAKIYLSPPGGTAAQCTLYQSGVTGTTANLSTAYVAGGAAAPLNILQTAGTVNDVTASTVNVASYNGTATGDITETYTITVIQAPTTPGNATTALLQLKSASGRDDVASFAPAAYGSATTVGTRGLAVTWSHTSNDFLTGQTWQLTVRQAWTVPVPTSGGTYTGNTTQTYIVKVLTGGLYTDATKPSISVTTAQGTDSSGPTTVTAATTFVAVGTQGVQIEFSGTGLRKGDLYYIVANAPGSGAYRTILLGSSLPSTLSGLTDLNLTLYIKKNISVPAQSATPGTLNWSANASGLTLNAGIQAFDSTLTNGGVQFSVPLAAGGTVYITYRSWVATNAQQLLTVTTDTDIRNFFGLSATADLDDKDHPIAYGLHKAVQNGNGQPLYFTIVKDPSSLTEWTNALRILEGLKHIFTLVPLSQDPNVLALYIAHIKARDETTTINGEWRHVWFAPSITTTQVISSAANSVDGNPMLATVGATPGVTPTAYTTLTVPAGNAQFVTNGVTAGDTVRYQYGVDAFGNATYNTYTVASVVNQDTILLVSGPAAAVSTAQKVEIWRSLTPDQVAANLTTLVQSGGNLYHRNKFVWPDQITDDESQVVPGWAVCAAYAGMIGGIAPQQGLRNVTISGFSAVPRSTSFFNNAQLNTLTNAGMVVVTQDSAGNIYATAARTPDSSSVDAREELTNRLDDAIRYLFYKRAQSHFGNANVSTTSLAILDSEMKAAIQHGISDTRIDRLGPMFTDANLTRLTPHTTIPDLVVSSFTVTRPFPLNDAQIQLTLGSQ